MHGFINNDWAAGCGFGLRGTHSYRTGYDTVMVAFPTCDISDVTIEPTRPHEGILPPDASTAQAGARPPARALTVRRGERALVLQVEGTGGAPKLTLADPKGRIYTPTTTVNKVVPDGNFVSAYLPGGNVTLLRVQHPRAGTWTLTPQAGSPAIDNVRSAEALPKAERDRPGGPRPKPRPDLERARARRAHDPLHRARQGRRSADRRHRQPAAARFRDRGRQGRQAHDRGAGHDRRRRAGDDAGRRTLPRARATAAATARPVKVAAAAAP